MDTPLLNCALALIALMNPISKVFVVWSLSEKEDARALRWVCIESAAIAAGILIGFVLVGEIVLQKVFHVEIYAFKIVGGIILFFRGYDALNKGLFFDVPTGQKLRDLAIVPLASPLIAGPATMAASLSFPTRYGLGATLGGILIASAVNLAAMLGSRYLGRALTRFNLMGALIRITGLIVSAIGVQMFLNGVVEFLEMM